MHRCYCGFWKTILSLIPTCIWIDPIVAQNYPDTTCKENLRNYTEQVYGLDDYIFQGRKYRSRNVMANGHPYFNDSKWRDAVIYSHGRDYSGIAIKYDIELDMIILQISNAQGKTNIISTEYATIDSFVFDTHFFINLHKINNSISEMGYYEKVFEGDLLYVVKHKKQFVKNYNSINPYGLYSKQLSTLCIIYGNEMVMCPNRKLFLHYFNPYEKQIRSFIWQQHIRFREANKNDLIILCRYVDELTGMNK